MPLPASGIITLSNIADAMNSQKSQIHIHLIHNDMCNPGKLHDTTLILQQLFGFHIHLW